MRKFRASVDHNQKAVVKALREAGRDVICLNGVFDLLVGYKGVTWIVEVKNEAGRNRLTDTQKKWLGCWRGNPILVVTSPEEAIRLTEPSNYQASAETSRCDS